MVARNPTDTCLLCKNPKHLAIQKNSHITPAALLKSNIGKRGKEHSFLIDTGNATVDEYFGRDRLDNPSTEIKENHHARDYYFCPDCERKMGVLEGQITPHLTEHFRDPKFASNYETKNLGDIAWKELSKVNPADFYVFFLITTWRKALQQHVEENRSPFTTDELETIRKIIDSYLSGDPEAYKNQGDNFGLMVLSPDAASYSKANIIEAVDGLNRPNVFLINDFIVLVYKESDLDEGLKKPPSFFHFPPKPAFITFYDDTPKIIILPQTDWDTLIGKWWSDIANDFANSRDGNKYRNNFGNRRKKSEKLRRKKHHARRARKVLKSQRRR